MIGLQQDLEAAQGPATENFDRRGGATQKFCDVGIGPLIKPMQLNRLALALRKLVQSSHQTERAPIALDDFLACVASSHIQNPGILCSFPTLVVAAQLID